MSIRIIILFVLLLTFSFIYCSPNYYTVETFPDSLVKPELCNLSSPGYVCDSDHLLKPFNDTFSGAEYLSEHLRRIRYTTNCSCSDEDRSYGSCQTINPHGYTISVVIIRSIGRSDGMTNVGNVNQTLQVFAEALRRRQNRGQCADDALIIVVDEWKAIHTAVGEVTGKLLTSDVLMRVNQETEQLFAEANYLYGLTFMIDRYGQILQQSVRYPEAKKYWWMIWSRLIGSWLNIFLSFLVLFTFAMLITLISIRFCCNRKQTYTEEGLLTRDPNWSHVINWKRNDEGEAIMASGNADKLIFARICRLLDMF
uniref:TPM domain-containing protein n=1 Tax=Setaria digitata TaxID=48799 RepID=A0A915PRU7_9BILA